MTVPLWLWVLTVVIIIGLLAFDFIFHVRKAHEPTLREAATWSAIYVSIAITFGICLFVFGGHEMGIDYFTGWLVEYSLSVDNLFVFLIIMGSFAVPRVDQQKVLLFGIVFALIARAVFIALGKAMIESWSWTFYLFGLVLVITAGKLLAPEDGESDEADNFIIRLAKRFLHTTDHYDGDKLFTYENGKRVLTPMLLVMVAIGGTDLLFALDSVPAIYGVTQNVYIVFTATAFAMMGLRQLYFLIDDLLDRLVFLKYGLATILGFIGIKLILEALHTNTLWFINGGNHVPVYVFGRVESLSVVGIVLAITIVASLFSPKGVVASAVRVLDRKCHAYLHEEYHGSDDDRRALYDEIIEREKALSKLNPELVAHYRDETGVELALQKVHKLHGDLA